MQSGVPIFPSLNYFLELIYVLLSSLSEAEVCDFCFALSDEHVCCLDVAVDDAFLGKVIQSFENVSDVGRCLFL